jgi:hypothetical protein
MLHSRPLVSRSEFHHFFWRGSPRNRVDFLPSLGRLEQDPHGMETADSIGACNDGRKVLDLRGECGEAMEDALVLER